MFRKSIFVLLLVFSSICEAVPTNGDFSEGLDPWKYSGLVSGSSDGKAFFDVNPEDDGWGLLWQNFTLPDGELELSFTRIWDSVQEDGGPVASDTFTVSLLNLTTDDLTMLYYINTEGVEWVNDTLNGAVNGDNVTLDVSSFAREYVRLTFGLFTDVDDGFTTTVLLDDVKVSVIPIPSAVLLGGVGVASVAWLRKRRKL